MITLTSLMTGTSALALQGHAFGKSFAEPGEGPGQLEGPTNIAVNEATGDVYVVDKGNDRVEYFVSSGAFVGAFDGSGTLGEGSPAGGDSRLGEVLTGKFSEPEGIAVDNTCHLREEKTEEPLSAGACKALDPSNGDVYVVDAGHSVVDKFGPTGEYLGQIAEGPEGPFEQGVFGVAVDTAGQVWLSEVHRNAEGERVQEVDLFSNALVHEGAVPITVGFLEHPGLAVDANDDLYVVVDFFGTRIVEISRSGRVLNPGLGPEPPSGVATDMERGEVYTDGGGAIERFGPRANPIERFGTQGLGVGVNSSTGQVFVATPSGTIDEYALEPPKPPTIEGQSVLAVHTDSATVGAEINPRGAATQYVVEYGRCTDQTACASSPYEGAIPLGGGPLGSDFEIHTITATIDGLQAHTSYHARVVAHNTIGGVVNSTEGAEVLFVTQSSAYTRTLPDRRRWELVSPAEKHGGLIQPIEEQGVVQASDSGDAITYLSSTPTESEAQGFSNSVQILSVRTSEGWLSRDLALPHEAPTGKSVGVGQEYRLFSEDLSLGGAQPLGPYTPASDAASESTPYLRSDFTDGGVCTETCYRPLVTGCPPAGELCKPAIEEAANVPPGTHFGGESSGRCIEPGEPVACGVQVRGGTPDLSHVVLESKVSLLSGFPAGLYEWSAGVLAFVGDAVGNTRFKAISADGSLVVFEALNGLLVHDVETGETIQVDGEGKTFLAASADGRRVFYLAANRDIDECEVVVAPSELACRQSDLTPGHPGVLGLVGTSVDGSWLYFVADGAITPGAVSGACQVGAFTDAPAECNLYALHFDGSRWEDPKLVGVISGDDFPDWSAVRTQHVGRVSPDGEWLAFMSLEPMTGYDNRDAASGQPDEEVFLYHAAGDGTLVCASCNPTDARPEGVSYGQLSNKLVGGDRVWERSIGIAANVPGWTPYADELALYDSRFVDDSGRLFFNASDALVPGDVNAGEDVYEFEPLGLGDCAAESPTFTERSGGCVELISSGLSGSESGFVDASVSGGDVFFLTAARLVSDDVDGAVDLYDAHECTAAAPCITSESAPTLTCTSADGCKAAPTASSGIFAVPLSSVFSGPDDEQLTDTHPQSKPTVLTRAEKLERALSACKRRAKRQRPACARAAHRKFGSVRRARKHVA